GYFFPKAKARFATSFFKVNYAPMPDYPVTMIPPIVGQDVKEKVSAPVAKQITVYISAASQIRQSMDELATVFACFPNHTFLCFSDGHLNRLPPNIQLYPNTRTAFLDALCQSSAVIATAGHNLITEALYLRVPMFLLPFAHYEQQLNAHIIASEGLGYADSLV